MRGLLGSALAVVYLALALASGAEAQVDAEASGNVEISGTANEDRALDHWWLGAYFRHLWIPSYMTEPFFDRAPSVTENGGGLVATYRTGGGLNVEMGLGFMPYGFEGPFLADGQPDTDTELVESDLDFLHLTGSLMWDIEFHKTVALEIGFGLDMGVLLGDITRNEAYFDDASKSFRRCSGPLDPPTTSPADEMTGEPGEAYCALPEDGTAESDPAREKGEHYDIEEPRVPPVMLFPMVPHLALRVQPFKHLTLKAELGFGVVQVWVGLSLHASFGLFEKGPSEVFTQPDSDIGTGRVLGRVVDAESGSAVSGATVKLQGTRALSALATGADGRFVVDRLDAGNARFEVAHPDYSNGVCEADVPKAGGDVAVECHLTPRARVGAISGQIEGEGGGAVKGASVELTGPRNETLASDERGLFAAVDLPVGTYRLRVQADDYLAQVVEIEVVAHETAMPQVILLKKPARSLVQLRKKEIVIKEQVQFATGSAEILAGSNDLLSQVADVLLRQPSIELVEVQGHTDSTGGRELNMTLSQQRADAVRDWLIKAGVAGERLQAKGYGPDEAIRPNNTPANRAVNRRVQFIIRQQSAEVVPE
jgi:outer membrane protein OmpA-like peptidoglycan-associated protein